MPLFTNPKAMLIDFVIMDHCGQGTALEKRMLSSILVPFEADLVSFSSYVV